MPSSSGTDKHSTFRRGTILALIWPFISTSIESEEPGTKLREILRRLYSITAISAGQLTVTTFWPN